CRRSMSPVPPTACDEERLVSGCFSRVRAHAKLVNRQPFRLDRLKLPFRPFACTPSICRTYRKGERPANMRGVSPFLSIYKQYINLGSFVQRSLWEPAGGSGSGICGRISGG